jgi:hypothetical protein
MEFRHSLSAFNVDNSQPHSVDFLVDDLGASDHSGVAGHLERRSRCLGMRRDRLPPCLRRGLEGPAAMGFRILCDSALRRHFGFTE